MPVLLSSCVQARPLHAASPGRSGTHGAQPAGGRRDAPGFFERDSQQEAVTLEQSRLGVQDA
jgi:hypothetical protein